MDKAHQPEKKSTDPQENQQAARKRSTLSWLFLIARHFVSLCLGLFLQILLFCLLAIVAILFTQTGREWLVVEVLPELLQDSSIQLEMTDFYSPDPGHWQFESLLVFVNAEPVFESSQLLLKFDAMNLLIAKLDIFELSAQRINIHLPESSESEEETEPLSLEQLQDYLIPVQLHKLAIKQLEFSPENESMPPMSLNGSAALFGEDYFLTSDISIELINEIKTRLNLVADVDQEFVGHIKLKVDEAAGGWLGKQIKHPAKQAINIKAELISQQIDDELVVDLKTLSSPWTDFKVNVEGKALWNNLTQRLSVPGLTVQIDQHKQHVEGWWQDSSFEVNAELAKLPLAIFSPFQELITTGNLSGEISAKGSLTSPQLSANINAETDYAGHALSLKITANGDLQTLRVNHADIILGEAKLSTSGSVSVNDQVLDLAIHSLTGPLSIIKVFDVDLPNDLAVDFHQTQGKLYGPFLAPFYEGQTKASVNYKTQTVSVEGGFKGDIQQVELHDFDAQLKPGHLKASGKIDWFNEQLLLQINAKELPHTLLSLLDVEIPDDLAFNFHQIQGKLYGSFLAPFYEGQAKASVNYKTQTVAVESGFKGDIQKVELRDFEAQLKPGHISASGTIDWFNEQLLLRIDADDIPHTLLNLVDVDLPSRLSAGFSAQGIVSGTFSEYLFDGMASAKGQYVNTQFDVHTQLSSSTSSVQLKEFDAQFQTDEDQHIQAASLSIPTLDYHIPTNNITMTLSASKFPYRFVELADIELPPSLSGTIDAELQIDGSLTQPSIEGRLTSDGQFEGEEFNIGISGLMADGKLQLEDAKLNWHDTKLFVKGSASGEQLALKLQLDKFNLDKLAKFGINAPKGILDIHLALDGSAQLPSLKGTVQLVTEVPGLSLTNNVQDDKLVINTEINTENETLQTKTQFSYGKDEQGWLSLNSATAIPLINKLLVKKEVVNFAEMPLAVQAKGEFNLAWLQVFIDQYIQSFDGRLLVDTEISGTIESPVVNGSIDLKNARYENAYSQSALEDVNISLELKDNFIRVVNAKAMDASGGQLNLSGHVNLAPEQNKDVDLMLSLVNAALINREDVMGKASGELKLAGNLKELLASGSIKINPFQIMVEKISLDSIPEIEVSDKQTQSTDEPSSYRLPRIMLDILVGLDQQAYIRGRGIDAELGGSIKLTGTVSSMQTKGQFQTIRGQFELFSKVFKLENGEVLFSNEHVMLNIVGRHKAKDMDFIATLSGTLDTPKISLRTVPALPEDEALARLLFGRSISNISAIQAIQLATALQTLRGEGGNFDPLGEARKLLNVDRLNIESQESSEGQGIAIGVGKYLTDRIYIEATRTPEPAQPWKGSVEIELSPRINLETTTGGSSGFGGVELKWKKDY